MYEQKLYSGQGTVRVAEINAGVRGKLITFGDCPAASLTPSSSKVEHKDSRTGLRAVNGTLFTEQKMQFALTVDDFKAAILAIFLRSDVEKNPGATVTDEPMRAGLETGEMVTLAKRNVSALSIEGSMGTPLVVNVDYRIESAKHGTIEILDGDKFTLAASASYTAGPTNKLQMMSKGARRYFFRIEGLNTVDGGEPVLIEFETILEPGKVLNIINDAYGSLELTGDVMFVNGSFGLVEIIGE